MKPSYLFPTIIINNRTIKISEILSEQSKPKSEFEAETLAFIKKWLSGVENFNLTTSGSTGEAKSIELNRKHMQLSAELTAEALNLKEGQTALVCLNTQYIAGKMMLVRAFVTGMHILAVEPSSNPFNDLDEKCIPDFAAMVPLQLHTILCSGQQNYSRLNSMQCLIVGGSNLNEPTKQKINELMVPVYATFGMTETISHIALQRLNGNDADDNYTTLPGVKITQDARECLLIKTPYSKEWIATNDIVRIDSEEKFKWVGRWDNVINSGGVKVIPEKIEVEVEKVFKRLNIDRQYIVAGIPDEKLGERIVLLIEGEELTLDLKVRVFRNLRPALKTYEVPKSIEYAKCFVRTKTGKVNRKLSVSQIVTGSK